MDIAVENDAIVLRPIQDHKPRTGWAEAARAIADQSDDAPVWPEFANAADAELAW